MEFAIARIRLEFTSLLLSKLRFIRNETARRFAMGRAFVFPGQGAQTVGMGLSLAQTYSSAMAVYEQVDDALGEKLSDLIWNGGQDDLSLTRNAQPALMATSLAAIRALGEEGTTVKAADLVAGHSLGEYSALAAAGAIDVGDCARLLRKRGDAMQNAVQVGKGAMAAILGLDMKEVGQIAREASQGEICEAANDNDPGQVVVSGHVAAVKRAIEIAEGKGARRAVMLPVSAPFHCALMRPAADAMVEALKEVKINTPTVPLVANVLADSVCDAEKIRSLLVKQVTGAVRWRESVEHMVRHGIDETWEIGAGRALSGMIRRIDKSISTIAISSPENVKAAALKLNR